MSKNKIYSNNIYMDVKENPPEDYMKGVKVPIKHVLKNPEINLPKITEAVIKCNKIYIQTLQFMKLYLLDYYNKHNKLPIIDDEFINTCMKIQCVESGTGRPPKKEIKELKDKLKLFYDEHYKQVISDEKLDYTHLNTVLDYLTISILTVYENNIKQHYVEYVERYVNVVWKKNYIVNKIKNKLYLTKKEKDIKVSKLCNQLRKIKNDILNVNNKIKYKSDKSYHKWINEQKK